VPTDLPAAPRAAERPARRRPSWAVVLVSLAVALVSLAVAAGALLLGQRAAQDVDDTRASALAAARERTEVLTSYDHRSLDEDVAAVLATATGEFEAEYRKTIDGLRPTLASTKAVATAEVVAAGIERAEVEGEGPERAVVVVAVDQVIETAGAAPRTERNRLRMELVRPDGTWLVERVQRL
jgi:Mce-associated membrane protein